MTLKPHPTQDDIMPINVCDQHRYLALTSPIDQQGQLNGMRDWR